MPATPVLRVELEDELAAELERSRVLSPSHITEVGVIDGVMKRVELSVIECVETLGTELEVRPLSEHKRLVQ